MTVLPASTRRRLQRLQQVPCVWEGDRRAIAEEVAENFDEDLPERSECILWVDGSQGIVRSMEMVSAETGPEAVARSLLKAMEHPHNPAEPARPKKIIVKDREVQFFLRGVLQELDINVEYAPSLPLIDEIFRSFQEVAGTQSPYLPPQYVDLLEERASRLWEEDAPWEELADHQIIAVELNRWDIETLYVSVLGMFGLDYGIVLYRSLDSLKQFRKGAIEGGDIERLEEIFLGQDCLFITFEGIDEDEDEDVILGDLPWSEIDVTFGNLHPLEGLRSFLYEEEALTVAIVFEALHRFFKKHLLRFENEEFPDISATYKIPVPPQAKLEDKTVSVKVSALPELSRELLEMGEKDDGEEIRELPVLRDDLVPEKSFLSLGMVSWSTVDVLRMCVNCHQPSDVTEAGDGLPVVLIQTTRPKAKTMIQVLQEAGGLRAICFNPGENPFADEEYDLGIFQTGDENLFLFGEFNKDDPTHVSARKKWDKNNKKTKGYCGLIVAMGLTGASRGNPQPKDMLALFETRSLSPDDLGIGPLQMIPIPLL